MEDPKRGLNLVGTTIANIKNDLLSLGNVLENNILPKINKMVAGLQEVKVLYGPSGQVISSVNKIAESGAPGAPRDTSGGAPGGPGGNKIAPNGTESSGGGAPGASTAARVYNAFGGAMGVSNLIAQGMPSAAVAVQQDLLTTQSGFYGQGGFGGTLKQQTANVRALQNKMAQLGIATNAQDTAQALAMAQSLGLSGATNFNQVMQGAGIASAFAPGIGAAGATQVMGTLNSPQTVNMLRTVGINMRGAGGQVLPIPQIVDQLWNMITSQSGGAALTEQDIQISLMPGNGLANMLNTLVGGDPNAYTLVSNMLLARAKTGTPVSSMNKQQLADLGLTTATVNKMSNQTAAQTQLLNTTASATAAGYGVSADLGTAMNNFATAAGPLTQALGAFSGAFTGTMGLGGGTFGTIIKTLLSIGSIAGLAKGGSADAKTPYIVGEKGPELFVPKTDGVVIPNNLLGELHRDGDHGTSNVKAGGADTTKVLYNFLIKQGLSKGGAEGVIGNLAFESGLSTTAVGDSGTSYGLAQWHDSRWQALNKFAASKKLDPSSLDAQEQFLMYELNKKGYSGLLSTLKDPKTTKLQAAGEFMTVFERPKIYDEAKQALQRANMYGKPVTGESYTSGSSSSTSPVSLTNTSALTEYQNQIQALLAMSSGALSSTPIGPSNTYNHGPLTINISGATDTKKTFSELQKFLIQNNLIASVGSS